MFTVEGSEVKRSGVTIGTLTSDGVGTNRLEVTFNAQQADVLNDRGLMGEGCINIKEISDWVDATGFTGHREVEIFSNKWWGVDQNDFLDQIVSSYSQLYS